MHAHACIPMQKRKEYKWTQPRRKTDVRAFPLLPLALIALLFYSFDPRPFTFLSALLLLVSSLSVLLCPSSINYTLDEYASDVVGCMKEACLRNNINMPVIISESGRSVTAHHSIIVFNVTDATTVQTISPSDNGLYATSVELPEVFY